MKIMKITERELNQKIQMEVKKQLKFDMYKNVFTSDGIEFVVTSYKKNDFMVIGMTKYPYYGLTIKLPSKTISTNSNRKSG